MRDASVFVVLASTSWQQLVASIVSQISTFGREPQIVELVWPKTIPPVIVLYNRSTPLWMAGWLAGWLAAAWLSRGGTIRFVPQKKFNEIRAIQYNQSDSCHKKTQ